HTQLMALGIDGEGLRHFPWAETVDLADERTAVPFRLARGAGALVLDLLAVGREACRSSVDTRDENHRVGLNDRQTFGRFHDVAHGVALPRALFRIHPRRASRHTTPC